MDERKGAETMNEFFNLFAYVYSNLEMYDLDNYGEDTANAFVYSVRDWLNGTEPETETPVLELAYSVMEPAVNRLKETDK